MMRKISEGIYLLQQLSDKYTTNQLEIKLYVPYTNERAMTLKLLAKYLENGAEKLANRSQVEQQLAYLYGTTLGITVNRMGEYLEFSLTTSCVKESFLQDNGMTSQWLALIQDILFRQQFGHERRMIFDKEKTQLLQEIAREKDQPEIWSMRLLYHQLLQTTHEYYIEMAKTLTMADIQREYDVLCSTASIYVVSHGTLSDSLLDKWIQSWQLSPRTSLIDINKCRLFELKVADGTAIHQGNVQQSYIATAYAVPKCRHIRERILFILANAMFGGSPTSLLFRHIRETKGRAYNIQSMIDEMRHLVVVNATVEKKYCQEVVDDIHTLWTQAEHLFTMDLFNYAREVLLSETLEALDSPLIELENVFAKEMLPIEVIDETIYQEILATLTLEEVVAYIATWKRVGCNILQGKGQVEDEA